MSPGDGARLCVMETTINIRQSLQIEIMTQSLAPSPILTYPEILLK